MSFDQRTRSVDTLRPVDVDRFHAEDVPRLLAVRGDLASRAFRASGLSAMTIGVGASVHTWRLDPTGSLEVVPGDPGGGRRADLSPEWFSDLVNDVRSAMAVMIANEPVMERGRIGHLVAWETTLRALVDGRPAYEPGLIGFTARDGGPLDLDQSFSLDDDPDDLSHFLAQTGHLHLRRVFTAGEMACLDAEIARWRDRMTPDDDRAWYAKVGDDQVCVRVTNLGPGDVDFPHAERLAPIAALAGAGRTYAGTDLLVKPVGVDEGLSDLPWHRDCDLGLHAYRCATVTCGLAVTPSGPDNGQLGVLMGSHRANLTLFDLDHVDLPRRFLTTDTGDVTVHLSCALHTATPPIRDERRVSYSSFRLPGDTGDLERTIDAVRDQAGRDTYAPG